MVNSLAIIKELQRYYYYSIDIEFLLDKETIPIDFSELNIDNDGVLEKYLLKDKIIVKNQDIKGQIENLVQSGRENIVVLKEDKKSINSAKKEKNSNDINVKRDNIAIDKNSDEIYRKNELIEKINHILQNLENERLKEVLRYVKRKKNQKNK